MKKNGVQLLNWSLSLIGLIALVAAINFALSLRPQGSSQGSDIHTLEERLAKLGIPVKSVSVTQQSPLEIEVVLRSSGSDEKISQDDLWNKFLAEREVELAYLNFDIHIEKYRLILVTSKGNTIYDSTVFLYSDLPSQKLTQTPPSSVENYKTKEILEDNLDLQGLKLLTLDVPSSYNASNNSKLVTLDLSTGTSGDKIDIAQINEFIMKVRPQIEDINSRFGTRIVLIHIQIKDSDDKLLVNYMEDIETGRQYSWTAENIEGSWYPQPAPAIDSEPQETSIPVASPTTASPKSTTLPTPSIQPTSYPPPPTPIPYP